MKFFLPLLLFPFLCVKCCPWDDCEGGDLVCPEILPVSDFLASQIAYTDGETVRFMFEGEPAPFSTMISKLEVQSNGTNSCENFLFSRFSEETPAQSVAFRVEANEFFDGISMTLQFGNAEAQRIFISFNEFEAPEIGTLGVARIIADTTFTGTAYDEVMALRLSDATDSGDINAIFYSRLSGLLRVERINHPAFFRVE